MNTVAFNISRDDLASLLSEGRRVSGLVVCGSCGDATVVRVSDERAEGMLRVLVEQDLGAASFPVVCPCSASAAVH